MSIVFESYTVNDGNFTARLPFRAVASDVASAVRARLDLIAHMDGGQTNDGQISAGLPALRAEAFAAADGWFRADLPLTASWASNTLAPDLAVFLTSLPELTTSMDGYQVNDGEVIGNLPLRTLATDAAAVFRPQLPLTAYFSDGHVSSDRVALLIQQPELVSSMVPGMTVGLADHFAGRDSHEVDAIQALMDLMRLSDSYSSMAEILQSLMDGISLADVAQMIWQADLLDQFIASAVQEGTAQITVLLADTFDTGDATTAISDILAAIRDGFYVTLTIATGEDVFTAWVMTPETKAMRSYTNWDFNSYATLGGQFLAAGPAGIYRVGGATDDGVAIRAAIRTGLLNFGSENMKAVSRAYIGATTAGNLLLRVQATTFKGEQLEQTYRMVPANTTDQRAHKVDVGKGFRSVYWTFELANDTDGADFEVTDWHVLPVTISGRLI